MPFDFKTPFQARRLPNRVTEITDPSGVHCFLVEGETRAVLIDTMTGIRGLKEFVSTLTDLPVQVALTHGHMDHAGGVFEFGPVRHPSGGYSHAGRPHPARQDGICPGTASGPGERQTCRTKPPLCRTARWSFPPSRLGTGWTWEAEPWRCFLCRDTPRVPCATWIRTREISLPGTPATTIPW